MIEKISSQKATTDEFLHQVALKLNEVIEAVNTRPVVADCGCWTQGDSWHRCSRHVEFVADATPYMPPRSPEDYQPLNRSSGFRPLHIEDGQVQETIPAFHVDEYGLKWIRETREQTFGKSSVPEAEPQEQERSFAHWIAKFESACRSLQIVTDRQPPEYVILQAIERRDQVRRELMAAAHREYAQPEKKVCDHVRVRFGCVADGHTQPPQWQYVECVDCEDRMAIPAAQPGKGV